MEDAAAVGVFQRTGNLNREAECLIGWQRTLQSLAFDVLEDQIALAYVVDLTDVRMVECRNCAGFLIEAIAVGGRQPLDRDDAIEASVAGLPDLAHPASPKWRQQCVGAELNTDSPIVHRLVILALQPWRRFSIWRAPPLGPPPALVGRH